MRQAVVLGCALVLVMVVAAPTHAAVAAAGPGGYATWFATPVVVITEGEGITFANTDVAPHNFTASDVFVPKKQAKKAPWCSGFPKGKCPLFRSDTITLGNTTEVDGLERVVSGKQYGFVCTIHANMTGILIVL